jgi:hypothetical protein
MPWDTIKFNNLTIGENSTDDFPTTIVKKFKVQAEKNPVFQAVGTTTNLDVDDDPELKIEASLDGTNWVVVQTYTLRDVGGANESTTFNLIDDVAAETISAAPYLQATLQHKSAVASGEKTVLSALSFSWWIADQENNGVSVIES